MTGEMKLEKTVLNTHFGEFEFHCYSWGPHEEDNILVELKPWGNKIPLLRIQSACYSAEIFRSLDCDCHEQLESSLRRIQHDGGLLIYMLCDGRGAGLLTKIRGLELGRTQGLDTAEAYDAMGVKRDPREYDRAVAVLNHLGITNVRLLTNNPRKLDGLLSRGIRATREPLEIPATTGSIGYLKTKKAKMGHMLDSLQD